MPPQYDYPNREVVETPIGTYEALIHTALYFSNLFATTMSTTVDNVASQSSLSRITNALICGTPSSTAGAPCQRSRLYDLREYGFGGPNLYPPMNLIARVSVEHVILLGQCDCCGGGCCIDCAVGGQSALYNLLS